MTIHSTAVVSIYGGSGIMVDTASSINIAIDDGFVLGIGRILYHNLLGEIEDIEKRKKVNQYLKSHDNEMIALGCTLYWELTAKKQDVIKDIAIAIRDRNITEICNQIRMYGYGY